MTYVFDIETDGINATKIHCLSLKSEDAKIIETYTDYKDIANFLLQNDLTLVGHNIIRYDIPTLERLLNIKIHARLIDTLSLSWYIAFDRPKHGLEGYGEDFGVPKPKIEDWQNLSAEEYAHRCSEDVKINHILWMNQRSFLLKLYKSEKEMNQFIDYLSFKMDCLREQEQIGFVFDKELCLNTLQLLEKEKEEKIAELKKAMPPVPVKTKKSVPKVLYKANGSLSEHGKKWFALLESMNLAPHTPEVEVIKEYEEPNPNSNVQLKDWLFSLGWQPEHLKYVRNKENNTVKQIPQIASKQGGGEICDSIKKLAEKEPSLSALDGLSVISHRISLFTGFLKDEQDGKLYAKASGLTNTLRLQHAVIVNLPSVERKYGKEVRSCLIANPGNVLCGSDLSGIEDSTKRHYIFKYDPKYVEEMNTEGFDPHLDIAMLAGFLTKEQVEAHKAGKENHKAIRQKAKVVNFSATYKVGAETLARNSGLSLKEAKRVLRIYWERNKAILQVENDLLIQEINGSKWLQNPVSGFWYSLRAEKDKFSTLNQGTAVYVFDVWLMFMRALGIQIGLQYHDEVLFNVKEGRQEITKDMINKAIEQTNNLLKLNVKVGCSIQFGKNYAECH